MTDLPALPPVNVDGITYIRLGVAFRTYQDPKGGIAVVLEQRGEYASTMSINAARIAVAPLAGDDCFWLNPNGPAPLIDALVGLGVFEFTGRTVMWEGRHIHEARLLGSWSEAALAELADSGARRLELLAEVMDDDSA